MIEITVLGKLDVSKVYIYILESWRLERIETETKFTETETKHSLYHLGNRNGGEAR